MVLDRLGEAAESAARHHLGAMASGCFGGPIVQIWRVCFEGDRDPSSTIERAKYEQPPLVHPAGGGDRGARFATHHEALALRVCPQHKSNTRCSFFTTLLCLPGTAPEKVGCAPAEELPTVMPRRGPG
jgi:hypothetical protein